MSKKERKPGAQENKLGANQKIGVLFCAMVSAVATGYVPNYINLYYTDTVGVPMSAVAMILMLTKITDGITDIIMGMIVDRTHTKLGKARPWILAGGIGIAISIMLLFNCPGGLSTGAKIAFCAGCYFLANPFFGTMTSVACGAMNNLLTADSKHRGVLGVFSAYGSLVPVLLIGLVVPNIRSNGSDCICNRSALYKGNCHRTFRSKFNRKAAGARVLKRISKEQIFYLSGAGNHSL